MTEENSIKQLKESLSRDTDSAWGHVDREQVEAIAKDYMGFLAGAKTERVASNEIVRRLEDAGFSDLESVDSIGEGDKVYVHYRHKVVLAIIVGSEPGNVRIVGSHLDSPRLDLKPNPISEGASLALLKTHYYGGVKKYQWTNVDLALYGVIHDENGKKHEFTIGEADDEPRFIVSDLLPHLAKKQMEKNAKELIEAEQLVVFAAHVPYPETGKKASEKLALLKRLNEDYGLTERDFPYAELTLVPAGTPREIGFDKSLIAAYGHDDKSCAYASLRAIVETEKPTNSAVSLWVDKEEIGSDGDTGAQSFALYHMLSRIYEKMDGSFDVWNVLHEAKALSADVTAAMNPNFTDVHDEQNASQVGRGVVVEKYTGAGGKYSANDASAEYLNEIRQVFAKAGVRVQPKGGLGKVDLGGGGTIAKYLSRYGTLTVDCGPAVLGMHAPREVMSKVDVHESYRAYKAFYE